MAPIQERWFHNGRIMGLNVPGYTLFFASGICRHRACILMMNETAWMLPGFSCRYFVAVVMKYNEEGAEQRLVVCSACFPFGSEDSSSKELEECVRYCENENLSGCRVRLQCTS